MKQQARPREGREIPVKVVVLISGGMDSVTAFHDALRTHEVVAGLSFEYGAKRRGRELPMAAWHCAQAGIPIASPRSASWPRSSSDLLKGGGDIPEGHYEEESMKRTVVPFRNGIMLAIAAGFAESRGAEGVVIAAHAGITRSIPTAVRSSWRRWRRRSGREPTPGSGCSVPSWQ